METKESRETKTDKEREGERKKWGECGPLLAKLNK